VKLPRELIARFPPTRRYLIGVSGGRDSVALLDALLHAGYRRLIVCHLDHQLRGRASTADAKFVKTLATKLDLECEIGRVDIAAQAKRTKQSLETAGRHARYGFFARIARRRRCRTLFLGHHADDLVETFLLNLFRGAGPAGLSAIRPVTTRSVDGAELTIVRPLLGFTRAELDSYIRERGLKYRDDASNDSVAPMRNRVRHQIIPYIEKQLNRNVSRALWRAATIAADEADWADAILDASATDSRDLAVRDLREQPRAFQRRRIQRWLQSRGVVDLDFDTIELVRTLIEPDAPHAKTNLPRDRHARRRAGKLFLE
jgi:tRNA(Ile)-lysidine synthase